MLVLCNDASTPTSHLALKLCILYGHRYSTSNANELHISVKVMGKRFANYGACVGGLRGLQYIELALA